MVCHCASGKETGGRAVSRKEFPARVKAAALKRCMDTAGVPHCEGKVDRGGAQPEPCAMPMRAGNLFFDHDKADGLGGEPTLEKCRVLCGACHDAKTFGHDNPIMQKADRIRKKHYGIKRSSKPLPGTKRSGLRKRMDGTVERRP